MHLLTHLEVPKWRVKFINMQARQFSVLRSGFGVISIHRIHRFSSLLPSLMGICIGPYGFGKCWLKLFCQEQGWKKPTLLFISKSIVEPFCFHVEEQETRSLAQMDLLCQGQAFAFYESLPNIGQLAYLSQLAHFQQRFAGAVKPLVTVSLGNLSQPP